MPPYGGGGAEQVATHLHDAFIGHARLLQAYEHLSAAAALCALERRVVPLSRCCSMPLEIDLRETSSLAS